MANEKKIQLPLTDEVIGSLKAGDKVLLSGVVYTGRDAAHKRMVDAINRGDDLPFDIRGQVIYYVGPAPAKPGYVIGSAGPTTSGRMDAYAPLLIERGLKGMIGKGSRSREVVEACMKYKAVYFGAVGGAGALLSKRIRKMEVVAYEELGPEAVYRLEVEDFPVFVVNDIYGGDLYKLGVEKYKRSA